MSCGRADPSALLPVQVASRRLYPARRLPSGFARRSWHDKGLRRQSGSIPQHGRCSRRLGSRQRNRKRPELLATLRAELAEQHFPVQADSQGMSWSLRAQSSAAGSCLCRSQFAHTNFHERASNKHGPSEDGHNRGQSPPVKSWLKVLKSMSSRGGVCQGITDEIRTVPFTIGLVQCATPCNLS